MDQIHNPEAMAAALAIAARHPCLAPHLDRLTPLLLADRPEANGRHFVLRLTGPAAGDGTLPIDVVLKGDTTGATGDGFARAVAGHRFALDKMGPQAVPEILSVDEATRSMVLPHIQGQSAQQMLELAELGLTDAQKIMRSCGTWLGQFHRATQSERRKINPTSMVNWLGTMRSRVETRAIDVPRRDLFLACAEQIPALAEDARGAPSLAAVTHGDMHLRNLLITDHGAVGIDFGPTREVNIGHDLSKLLARYHGWFDPDPNCAPVQAFWQGYGTDLAALARPAVSYLLPIQLLKDWCDIPKRREDRREGQQHRLRQILKYMEVRFQL